MMAGTGYKLTVGDSVPTQRVVGKKLERRETPPIGGFPRLHESSRRTFQRGRRSVNFSPA